MKFPFISFLESGRLAYMIGWANKLKNCITHSESQWQDALHDLRAQNIYGYFERLNASEEFGIGDLGM